MAWGDNPLDIIQDAVDHIKATAPRWKSAQLSGALLDKAAHDKQAALSEARSILRTKPR